MKWLCFIAILILPFILFSDLLYEFSGRSWTDENKKEIPIEGAVYLKSPTFFRVEFKKSENPMLSEDSVILSKDLKSVYLLNTKDKTYAELDFEKLMQSMANITGSLLNLQIENPKVEVRAGNEDKNILGFPCKHIIVETSYDMKMKVLFIKNKQKIHYISQYWIAKDFPLILKDYYQEKSFKTGIPDLDKLIEQETSAVKGMVLKLKKVTETKNEKGEISKVYEETEIIKIEEKDLPSSYFEIPKDYKKIELFPQEEKEDKMKSIFGN